MEEYERNLPNLAILRKMANFSSRLEIVTQTKSSSQTYKSCFRNMVATPVVAETTQRPTSGTTITICGYLSSFPQLLGSFNSDTLFKKVKILLEGLSVIHSEVSFSVCDCSSTTPISVFQTKKQHDSKKAAHNIFQGFCKLIPFHSSSRLFKIKGLIGKNDKNFPRPHFTFINSRFFESVEINDLIDSVFLRIFQGLNQYYTIILHIKVSDSYCIKQIYVN